MGVEEDYIIKYSGLDEKSYTFSFQIDNSFFNDNEYTEISETDIAVEVILEKSSRILDFEINCKGTLELICDRCNNTFLYPVNLKFRLIVRISDTDIENTDDDVIYLKEDEYKIDLSSHIFDFILLQIPLKKTHDDSHDDSTCDPEALKLLDNLSSEEKTDPRWDQLKNIDFDN